MSQAEVEQLSRELTEAKLSEMVAGISIRSEDQPVKVVPFSDHPPKLAEGYFTQQKYIWLKTPKEMERILGVYGKFRNGALILQFQSPLRPDDYENKAYSYLPDGKEYQPKPNEKTYLPAKEPAPQWRLKHPLPADCVARLSPGQRFQKGQH